MMKLANKVEFSILSNIFTICIKTFKSVQTPKNVPSVRGIGWVSGAPTLGQGASYNRERGDESSSIGGILVLI